MAHRVSEQGTAAAFQVTKLSKWFGAQQALADMDLTLRAGEVHALVGQNGSGKSTLVKILAGFHPPDAVGDASVCGQPLALGSAAAAHTAGIRFVHQDLALIDDFDVVDNLALGERYAGRWWLRDRRERSAAAAILGEYGIDIDPGRLVRNLTPSERTMVAVARALRTGRRGAAAARVLVLDEVSAALPEREVEAVFTLIRRIRDQGSTVLYVTHRLEEVFALADRVTVLRDGIRVATTPVGDLNHDGLVKLIVGRPLDEVYPAVSPLPRQERVLSVRGVRGRIVRDVDLDVYNGEIVGLAGLNGSGREELPYLLFGARPWRAGRLVVGDQAHNRMTPENALAAGLALIPADRPGLGSTPALSVCENLTLPRIPRTRLGWLPARREARECAEWLYHLHVRPRDPGAPLATLSGGNQQKVILARWFRRGSSVLIFDEPTQGVDIEAKAAIYHHLAAVTKQGASVLVASADHEELAAICDRVLVLRDGRVVAELTRGALTADTISELVFASATGEATAIATACRAPGKTEGLA